MKGLLGAQKIHSLSLLSISLLSSLPFLHSSLLPFIMHCIPRMIFLELHLHLFALLITNLKWLPTARCSHLPVCYAGPSPTGSTFFSMLHLLLLRNTHGNLSHVPLRIASAVSPSQKALSGSPSLEAPLPTAWISSFSDFQFHLLSISISSAPRHRGNYVFRWFHESISLYYQCHCLFLQERPRSFISLSPHWASSGRGNPGWALTRASRPGPEP